MRAFLFLFSMHPSHSPIMTRLRENEAEILEQVKIVSALSLERVLSLIKLEKTVFSPSGFSFISRFKCHTTCLNSDGTINNTHTHLFLDAYSLTDCLTNVIHDVS